MYVDVLTLFELQIQSNVVPDTLLKEWTASTYTTATEYWSFRKKLTQQIALAGFIEFVLHLTRLGPEMINIAKDCGNVTFNYFRFDIDDSKGILFFLSVFKPMISHCK